MRGALLGLLLCFASPSLISIPSAQAGLFPQSAALLGPGSAPLMLAQLPDSGLAPGATGEGGDQGDSTSVLLPPPGAKTVPIDSASVHGPAPSLPEPDAALADSARRSGPMVTTPTTTGAGAGAGATPPTKPAARRGILGAHPAAIVLGLIAVHVLIVKLITR